MDQKKVNKYMLLLDIHQSTLVTLHPILELILILSTQDIQEKILDIPQGGTQQIQSVK